MTTAYNNKRLNSKGFTLVELLIVIVIIGILSGVAITVIDPIKQQNRAKNAVAISVINKAALATEGYISAYGHVPSATEFLAGLKGAAAVSVALCAAGNVTPCFFTINANPLPLGCVTPTAGTAYPASGTTQCYFYYNATPTGVASTTFSIYARAFDDNNSVIRYDNTTGDVMRCTNGTPPTGCVAF